ncbi:MAG: phosphodiester glycosidase family protein [Clostridia bacterium]|nr:phosphodiester glycosidase family protein [Clostridia bacterium]
MKSKTFSKVIAFVLTAFLLVGMIPMTVFASIPNWSENNVAFDGTNFGTNGYYNVISKKDYTLVPGAATETEMVLNNAAGNRRQVLHIIEVDPSNPDVSILPGYYGIDKFAADPTNMKNQQAAGVTNVANYYDTTLGYKVVGAMNTALAYDNNAPYSYLVYNGQVLVDAKGGVNNFHSGACQTMLCVYKDEVTGECTCELRTHAQGLRGDEWQAIGANFAMVVNNGQLVTKTEERTSDMAARSLVGVKEDGTLVLLMNDGRGANNSKGFNNYELGESMLALGCKWAFNCDGGGSSSFVTRRAGEDDLVCRCVPCDGAERPTLNSVLVVSNVAPTGVLNNVDITSDYDYFAPGTTYTFGANAIDTHGYAMDMPNDLSWALSDDTFGTVNNGTFVSNGKTGNVTVRVISGGNVVGEKAITVANPETLNFAQASTVLPYGKSTTFEFVSKIGEFDVYLDGSSFSFEMSNPNAGTLDGLTFTATQDETIEGTVVTATYVPTGDQYQYTITFGKGSEIIWDFEDGDLHGFLGQQDAYDWQLAHGVETPFG